MKKLVLFTAGFGLAAAVMCVSSSAGAICMVVGPSDTSGDPGVAFRATTRAIYVIDPDDPAGSRVLVAVSPVIERGGGTAVLVMPMPAGSERVEVSAADFDAVVREGRSTVKETVTFVEDPALGAQCSDPHYSGWASAPAATMPVGLALATLGCGRGDVGATRAALMDGAADDGSADGADGAMDDGSLDAAIDDASAEDAGAVDLPSPGNLPVTDAFEVTAFAGATALDALRTWLTDAGFAISAEREAILDRYVAAGHGLMAVHVQSDAPSGHALAPIAIRFPAAEAPIWNELQYDAVSGGTLYTDAYVIARTRQEPRLDPLPPAHAAPYSPPAAFALHGAPEAWLTRQLLTRIVNVDRPDDIFVPSTQEVVVKTEIEAMRTVRIPAACCPDGYVPYYATPRTFTRSFEYPEGEELSAEDLAVSSSPPLEDCSPDYAPAAPDASAAGDDGGYGCGSGYSTGSSSRAYDAGRSSGGSSGSSTSCGSGGCGCSTPASPLGGSEPIVAALAWLWLGAWRKRRPRS